MRAIVLGVFFLLAGALASAAQAADTNAIRTKVLALENSWNQAAVHKDTKALEGLLGTDLAYIDFDGTLMNKSQLIASLQSPTLEPEIVVNDSMTAQVYGYTVVVIGIYREKGVSKGKPYLRRERFTDVWVLDAGRWVLVASQSTLLPH